MPALRIVRGESIGLRMPFPPCRTLVAKPRHERRCGFDGLGEAQCLHGFPGEIHLIANRAQQIGTRRAEWRREGRMVLCEVDQDLPGGCGIPFTAETGPDGPHFRDLWGQSFRFAEKSLGFLSLATAQAQRGKAGTGDGFHEGPGIRQQLPEAFRGGIEGPDFLKLLAQLIDQSRLRGDDAAEFPDDARSLFRATQAMQAFRHL